MQEVSIICFQFLTCQAAPWLCVKPIKANCFWRPMTHLMSRCWSIEIMTIDWNLPQSSRKILFPNCLYEEALGCWHQFYTLLPFGALSTNLPTSSLDRSVGGNCCNLPKNSLIRSFFFLFTTDLPTEYPRNVASRLPTGAAARWSCMA